MKVVLNGIPREIGDSSSVSDLVQEAGLAPERVAVEINLQIIDRAEFKTTLLKEGDKVEIIGFVGGGQLNGYA